MHEAVDGSTFWWILFSQFFEKRVKTFAPMFGVVVCEHNYIVPTFWVRLFLNQGFSLEIEWYAHHNPISF